jgi:hypothetical protein
MKRYMILAVDRLSGRVLDVETGTDEYSWLLPNALAQIIERHDLTAVDLVVRESSSTAPDHADAEPVVDSPAPNIETTEPNEDLPF